MGSGFLEIESIYWNPPGQNSSTLSSAWRVCKKEKHTQKGKPWGEEAMQGNPQWKLSCSPQALSTEITRREPDKSLQSKEWDQRWLFKAGLLQRATPYGNEELGGTRRRQYGRVCHGLALGENLECFLTKLSKAWVTADMGLSSHYLQGQKNSHLI